MTATVTPPNPPTQDASLEAVAESIRSFPGDYWEEGSGSASIEWIGDSGVRRMLTLVPDREEKTFYLNIHQFEGRRVSETWLSVGERTRLAEVFEVFDDYHASRGLFIAPDLAAACVEHFANTGGRSSVIEWITPSDVPDEGNY